MTRVAPALEAFFTERLNRQLHASEHTVASYRDTFRLLLVFVHRTRGKAPCELDFIDLDAGTIGAFLEHLELERGNSVRTRNTRLAAVHSFFRFASYREPAHAELIARVLAIPEKRTRRSVVCYLSEAEIRALLASADRHTWIGRRDHALLLTVVQSGLRLSELTALRNGDVILGPGAHLRVQGKGRKERCTPLTRSTAAVIGAWMKERGGGPGDALFPSRQGGRLSHDAVADLVAKYTALACQRCPSLLAKRVTPHTLRHSNAMQLLEAGVDTSVIALWLGHEHVQTTQIYLHGDLSLKERALARITPLDTPPGRYRPTDKLLAFLEGL